MMNASECRDNTSAQGNEDCGFNANVLAVVLPSLYLFIFVPALILNVSLAWVILQLKTDSTFMVYLKNLVVADLLMTLMIPVKASSELPDAALGLRMFDCRFSSVLFYCCMNISIVLMGLISLDRFFKVVRPCGYLLGQNLLFGRVACITVWVVLLGGATLPTIILTGETPSEDSSHLCMHMKSHVGIKFHEVVVWLSNLLFWVVLVLIGFCYACITMKVVQSYRNFKNKNTQGKRKTKLKVFIVLAVFLVCFAPFYIIRIPYTKLQVKDENSCMRASLKVAKDFSLWLSTTNICLDPVIYFFLCKNFRRKLRDIGIFRRFLSSMSETDENTTTEQRGVKADDLLYNKQKPSSGLHLSVVMNI